MFLSRYTAIAFGIFALLFPVRIPCGSAQSGCSITKDYRGRVIKNDELKPLSIMLLQKATDKPLPIKYR
jgi:hypothetical protein